MKNVLLLLTVLMIYSCKQAPAEDTSIQKNSIEYPSELSAIFKNHGGLDKWQSSHSMSYEIVKEEGNEKQFIDLKNRRERIEASNFTSGYNGKEYWVEADTSYKGNAKFYTNLMFYFYAMPFVLADEGITYTKVDPINFDNKTYPGYRISYGDDVGISPEDEYFIHFNPETNEMAWLGYTVTFFSGKKSEKVSYIRYDDWATHGGLKLPNSMTWYKVEEGKIIEPRNTRKFANINVSTQVFADSKFEKTPGAKIID